MAVKRKSKVKAKAKPKHRKVAAKRPVARKKPAPRARKPARKAAKRPAPKRRGAPPAAKPRVVSAPAPAPAAPGERIGVVTHYYGEPRVAVVKLETGPLRVGDTIHFRGHTTDFAQRVDSLQIEHAAVQEVGPDDDFGLKVAEHVREHDVVYKVK
jgi:putative protease